MKIVLHCEGKIREVIENAESIEIDKVNGNIKSSQGVILGSPCKITLLQDDEPSGNALALEKLKNEKIDELNNCCERSITSGFYCSVTGHLYGFSQYDQINMTSQYSYFIVNPNAEPIEWKTEDAGVVSHTRAEFLAVCDAANEHKRGNTENYWRLKEQVLTATSQEEIDKIKWIPWKPDGVLAG